MNTKKCVVGLLVLMVLSANAMAGKIPFCKVGIPSGQEKEDLRTARFEAVAGRGTVFNNDEKILPALSKNETYREYDLGSDRFGGRGAHRAVLRVLGGAKLKVIGQYYTDDHYEQFCELQ